MNTANDNTQSGRAVTRGWMLPNDVKTRWDTGDLRLRHRGISLTSSASGRWRLDLPPLSSTVRSLTFEAPASRHPPVDLVEIVWPLTMGAPLVAADAQPRAAGDVEQPASETVPAPTSAQELFDLTVGRASDQIHLALPWIRASGGGTQAIRQSRVGVRTARTLLRAYRPYFVERPVELEDHLGVLNDHLRAVRDLDSIDATIDSLAPSLTTPPDEREVTLLRQSLAAERKAAVNELYAEIAHMRTAYLLNDLAERPAVRLSDDDPDPANVARALIRRSVRSARQQARRTRGDFDDPAERLTSHLRIRTLVRRLRVTATATMPILGDDARRLARRAAAVQQQLGGLADLAKTVAWLSDGETATAVARSSLSSAAVANIDSHMGTWPGPWRRVLAIADAQSLSPPETEDR
jgi:CHAD domain-containing protein